MKRGLPLPTATDAAFQAWLIAARGELHSLLGRYTAGAITIPELQQAVHDLLTETHAGGVAFGRWRAGLMAPLSDADFLAGRAIADEQILYFARFTEALANGDISEAQAAARMDMYAMRVRGTASQAFLESSDSEALFYWILTAAEHCPDCPFLASQNPWLSSELYTTPGAGDTQCLSNCKCVLRREDGAQSHVPFAFPPLDADTDGWIPPPGIFDTEREPLRLVSGA